MRPKTLGPEALRDATPPNDGPVPSGSTGISTDALLVAVTARPFSAGIVAGLAFALLMALSLPPVGWWWAALFVPLPLLVVARLRLRTHTGRRVLGRPSLRLAVGVAVGTVPFWATHFIWVISASVAGYVPLVVYMSLYPALIVLTLRRLTPFVRWFDSWRAGWLLGAVLVAVAGTGIEFLRGRVVFNGAEWFLIGQPLVESVHLNWVASFGGFFVVPFLTYLVAANVIQSVYTRAISPAAVALVVLIAWVGLGQIRGESTPERLLRVAVVQTNVPQDNRTGWTPAQRYRDWETLAKLTYEAGTDRSHGRKPDLIVWPEGMFPGMTVERDALASERSERLAWVIEQDDGPALKIPVTLFADELFQLQDAIGLPILVSAIGYDALGFRADEEGVFYEPEGQYNSVFIVDTTEPPVTRYDKIHLTPFGEVMPYISAWPWLEKTLLSFGARGMSFDWDAGDGPVVLEVSTPAGPVWLATPVCFEATRGDFCRRLVFQNGKRTADLMVSPTNDGWFRDWNPGRWTHAMIARWRCVELRTPMIRAANTGVSMAIDARGRVLSAGITQPPNTGAVTNAAGLMIVETPLGEGVTVFSRTGDLVGWACFAGWALAALAGLNPRRTRAGS